MTNSCISLKEALESLSRRPGLLFGPDLTCGSDSMTQLLAKAFRIADPDQKAYGTPTEDNFRSVLDTMAGSGEPRILEVEREIMEGLRDLRASLDLPYLAGAGWSVCISLTNDLLFESALRNHLDATPTSRTVTVVDALNIEPPDRTTPIYKLLGNPNSQIEESKLAIRESTLLLRQQTWPLLMRTLPDHIREAPLFVVGTNRVGGFVRVVLSALLNMPRPNVRKLIFLKGDPALKDVTIAALCKNFDTQIVDASIREVSQGIAELALHSPHRVSITPLVTPPLSLSQVISSHESLVALVPQGTLPAGVVQRELLTLVDSLFRPASVDWAPFLAGLDLKRSATKSLFSAVKQQLDAPRTTHPKFIVAHGEAGIGKTMLLKRVAVDLAQEGTVVLWVRRSQSDNWMRHYRKFASELANAFKTIQDPKVAAQVVIFCDDPWGLRLDAGELLACFENVSFKVVFVFAVRSSNYFTADGVAKTIGSTPESELAVPYELDDAEIADLTKMLCRIGAVASEAAGAEEVRKIRSRNARDILCSLWYLVPESRAQLRDSLRDEYCRLGDIREAVGNLAQSGAATGTAALHAYECVTVTSNLDIGIPIEVLVRALGINYGDWIEMTGNGRPLWGLIYDEIDTERSTVTFRTRNEVVTRVLLELVNGGVGHSGEVRVLKDLLNACVAGGHVYRSFVVDVLVRGRDKLAKFLNYEQGVELYEIAKKALPHPDRVIEHHKGIWIDDVGHRHAEAYRQFEAALQCQIFPGAERDAPREHIHTSMAATAVRMVKDGELDTDKGFELVRDHLRQASSPTFFNGHTAHVSANLLFELAQHASSGSKEQVSLRSLTEALQEIEKGRQLIGAHGRNQIKQERSIAMLDSLQRRVLGAIPDTTALEKLAESMFAESGNQVGFEAAARRRLADAIQSDKGRAYNEVQLYLNKCFDLITAKKAKPSATLVLVRIDLLIRWRLQRPTGAVEWNVLRDDLREILAVPRYRDDLVKQFYFGVAQFQCGDITNANATFAGIRRLTLPAHSPNAIRVYFRDKLGNLQRFQGKLERKNLAYYFVIPELNTSIQARAQGAEGGPGATVHAYLGFALNGPVAVFTSPSDTETLLP